MNARFPYACHEALALAYEARGGTVVVRRDRNGSRKVSIDGKREVTVERAVRFLEAQFEAQKKCAA